MRVKLKDLNQDQVRRMKSVYGLSDAEVLDKANRLIDPNYDHQVNPSKRGKRFQKKRNRKKK